jgi:3-hydroxyacyl-[acyl-carrier-protein] dehydratase
MLLSHSQIKGILPHRHPMLLVDGVRSLEPGNRIVAVKCVTGSEACFAHLADDSAPQSYAYPRSLIVESFGQAASIIYCARRREQDDMPEQVMLFGSAGRCRFEGDVFPGETMEHRARLERSLSDAAIFSGEVWVGRRRIVEVGQVIVVLRPAGVLADGSVGDV